MHSSFRTRSGVMLPAALAGAWLALGGLASAGPQAAARPAKAHAEAGGDRTTIRTLRTGAEVSASCTACHAGKTHAFWEGSQHDQRNVSCISCHSVHDAKGRIVRLQQRE